MHYYLQKCLSELFLKNFPSVLQQKQLFYKIYAIPLSYCLHKKYNRAPFQKKNTRIKGY